MLKYVAVFLFLFSLASMTAQTTGSYTLNVTFPQSDYNVNRNLYFFVPTDYDENVAYTLVVGFRGGPHSNAGQFRDQLTFLADSLQAIILCPENSHHFNNQEGLVKRLFNYSVDTAMSIYNIDPDFIYLTGLSYGGRHAVIVGMDTDDGEIPEIRGLIPFATGSNGQLQPNYDAVDEFAPACICIGLDDNANFLNVARTLHQDLTDNGGISLLNEIPGVGHTVVFPTYPEEMMECFDFIEAQYSSVNSVASLDELGITIAPNPVREVLTLNVSDFNKDCQTMMISNQVGKVVHSTQEFTPSIDVTSLTPGTYWLSVQADGKMYSQAFIIR